ncbi:hypothetical protein NIES4102_33010 [Chondrocystis sp. NIES-4102]|nr:hypothetical protein NIES4102_33010 [Chondrocystis sp. NIES-4102]
MKIYTFNAPDDTRVEILWSLRSKNRDKIFQQFITQANYKEVDSIEKCQIAIYPYKAFNPETLELNDSIYDAAVLATRFCKPLIIDATSDSDVFLDLPTANILRCGLYKSLKKSFETECPFWSNYRTKDNLDNLTILPKRLKPAIGFCGTTSSIGKLSNISKTLLPSSIAKSVLAQGKVARQVDIRIREGMSLQLREIAIKILAADRRIDSYFDISDPRQSYYLNNESNRLELENLFISNISKCDYSLCVRGTGNYSGRFYMALNGGRIPVILDTDVVIPWEDKLHIIKIPLHSLEKIGDIILEHFEQTSEEELKTMKLENRAAYHRFIAPEKFLINFLNNLN